jgi:hypothetical protein
MQQKNFITGMRFSAPREKAPEWCKGTISVNIEEFVAYARANQDSRGWLNIDVKESKGGNLYCELNTYGRKKNEAPEIPITDPLPPDEDEIQIEDIPF